MLQISLFRFFSSPYNRLWTRSHHGCHLADIFFANYIQLNEFFSPPDPTSSSGSTQALFLYTSACVDSYKYLGITLDTASLSIFTPVTSSHQFGLSALFSTSFYFLLHTQPLTIR